MVPRLDDGRSWRPYVASPSDGPTSFSWMEWKRPSVDPDGMVTASEKGLTHCTKISPRSVSLLRLLASWILVCAPLITPNPVSWLLFTLQWMVTRERPGMVQLLTTCTLLARGRPDLSTQVSSLPTISTADLLKSIRHPCCFKNGILSIASSSSKLMTKISWITWSWTRPVSSITPSNGILDPSARSQVPRCKELIPSSPWEGEYWRPAGWGDSWYTPSLAGT